MVEPYAPRPIGGTLQGWRVEARARGKSSDVKLMLLTLADHADYDTEPFRSLNETRSTGKLRVYCLGIALGALDLWAGLETVAVFDADAFDSREVVAARRRREGVFGSRTGYDHRGGAPAQPVPGRLTSISTNKINSCKLAGTFVGCARNLTLQGG